MYVCFRIWGYFSVSVYDYSEIKHSPGNHEIQLAHRLKMQGLPKRAGYGTTTAMAHLFDFIGQNCRKLCQIILA